MKKYFKFGLKVIICGILLLSTGVPASAKDNFILPDSDYENAVVTQWVSPQDEKPLTYIEWLTENPPEPFTVQSSGELIPDISRNGTRSTGAILVMTNEDLYDLIMPEISQYRTDLANEGYTVYWINAKGGEPSTVQNTLRYYWETYAIEGAVIIGDFPIPWYKMDDDFDNSSSQFPIDLYYMDLDGSWGDANNDGLFDSHTNGSGNVAPDIYVTRLTASPLSNNSLAEEAALMRNYFTRNHRYRSAFYYDWHEINSSGTMLTLGDDDFSEVDLPFPFTYFGITYTSIFVSTNGFISFGEGFSSPLNACLPNNLEPNNAIYGFWDDLLPETAGGSGAVYYETLTDDIFVIEWDSLMTGGTNDAETFQIVLYSDGGIAIQYKTLTNIESVTVGLENNTGLNTIEFHCNGQGGRIKDGHVLNFSPLESYSQSVDNLNWQGIITTGTALTLGDDDFSEVALPFPFTFYGNTYNSTFVGSNGFLSFGLGNSSASNTPLPNTSLPNNAIYGFWDDLQSAIGGGSGSVYYQQIDSDTFVVEWNGVNHKRTANPITFQIHISRDGNIKVKYQTIADASEATVGLESDDSSRSTPYTSNGSGGSIYNGLALQFSPVRYISPQPYGLAYIDNDWAVWFGNIGEHRMDLMYEDLDVRWAFEPDDTTTRNDYLAQASLAPEFVHVMSHGYPQGHGFYEETGFNFVFSSEVEAFKPPSLFYNLFVCSGAQFTVTDYLAGKYVFDPYSGNAALIDSTAGLIAVGSTKTGSMLQFDYFYQPLGTGQTFGQAYLAWFKHVAKNGFELGERQWHYGMSIIGDPTLRLSQPRYKFDIHVYIPLVKR